MVTTAVPIKLSGKMAMGSNEDGNGNGFKNPPHNHRSGDANGQGLRCVAGLKRQVEPLWGQKEG